jgi:hypothetical protein
MQDCEVAAPAGDKPVVVEFLSLMDRQRWLGWASMAGS